MSDHVVRLDVNGQRFELSAAPDRLLVDVLRDDLGLTGTKNGCGVGVCGACSVLVDGRLVSSCLELAVLVDGSSVTTIEGMTHDQEISRLQDAFIRLGGFQCGICTPGQLIAAAALLREIPRPTEDDVRGWMAGNLCRCTGYRSIVAAILAAAGEGADRSDGPVPA